MQRVLLLCSARNGVVRRSEWVLRRAGRVVRTAVVASGAEIEAAVAVRDFDLIICPFLTIRIPAAVRRAHLVVVVHPGPVQDRSPSGLDWAITRRETVWGVTAVSAVDGEVDTGPVWSARTFALPLARKSSIYNSVVSDAAMEVIVETASKAALGYAPVDRAHVATRAPMRQRDRGFNWSNDPEMVLRRIHAADSSPGVLSTIEGLPVYLFDAHLGRGEGVSANRGTVIGRRDHAVEVACGGGSIWIGHLRAEIDGCWSVKAPAVAVLERAGVAVKSAIPVRPPEAFSDITYSRRGPVGTITFAAYNGAMTTAMASRLAQAIRVAVRQDTAVLVIRGRNDETFCNGMHLGSVAMSEDPAGEGWRNIKALNTVCGMLLRNTTQVTVGAFTGSAGAEGVSLLLGCDVVVGTSRAILDMHYTTMGLAGSGLHTYTLPRRVGARTARRLLTECEPIDIIEALDIGLIDQSGPDTGFDDWLTDVAFSYAEPALWARTVNRKRTQLGQDFARRPLDAYENQELGEMARNLFDNSRGFRERCSAFTRKSSSRDPLSPTASQRGPRHAVPVSR